MAITSASASTSIFPGSRRISRASFNVFGLCCCPKCVFTRASASWTATCRVVGIGAT